MDTHNLIKYRLQSLKKAMIIMKLENKINYWLPWTNYWERITELESHIWTEPNKISIRWIVFVKLLLEWTPKENHNWIALIKVDKNKRFYSQRSENRTIADALLMTNQREQWINSHNASQGQKEEGHTQFAFLRKQDRIWMPSTVQKQKCKEMNNWSNDQARRKSKM